MGRKREIWIRAEEVRGNCRVIQYGILDLFRECERMGYRVIRYPIGSDGILGFSQIRDGDRILFTNSSVRLSREIFSLAHEIGHMCLHMSGERGMYVDHAGTLSECVSDIAEREANYFAACLLMPEDEVLKYISLELNYKPVEEWSALDIAGMMDAFSVSFEMVLNRLQSLNKLSGVWKAKLDNEKNQKKVATLLKMIGGNGRLNMETQETKIPGEYIEWVCDNYNHGVIPGKTLERALEYFRLSMKDVADQLHAPHPDDDNDLEELIGGMDP